MLLSIIIIIFSSFTLFNFIPKLFTLIPNDLINIDGHLKYIATLVFMCAGTIEVLTIWHLRNERYQVIALGKILQAIATVLFQIRLYNKFGGLGLLYGYTLGLCLSLLYYSIILLIKDLQKINLLESLRTMKAAAIAHKNFPLFSTWSSLLNTLGNQLPILLFGKMAGVEVSGIYDMARKYTRAPLNLVGQSTFRVVSQRIGILENKPKEAANVLSTVFIKMSNYSILPFIISVALFEYLFILLLGNQWHDSGIYAQIISPWLFTIFISWPLTSAYNTFGFQKQLIVFNFIFVLSILLSFSFMYLLKLDTFQTLTVLSLLGSITRLSYCHWILTKCGVENTNKKIGVLIFYTITVAGVVYASRQWVN